MPEPIDTPEELEAHKTHPNAPQPETCDICWMDAPLTSEELAIIEEAEEND